MNETTSHHDTPVPDTNGKAAALRVFFEDGGFWTLSLIGLPRFVPTLGLDEMSQAARDRLMEWAHGHR